jgi:hypothetical protein
MADIKISQLPLGQSLAGDEKLAVVQGSVTIQATVADVIAGARSRSTHTGTQPISTVDGLQAALDGKLATGATATSALALAAGPDKTKLDSVQTGATANSTDAQLRDRSTHTGTQAVSTISGLQGLLDAKAPLASPTFTGTVSGSFSGALAGNASTATALATGSADRTKLDSLSTTTDAQLRDRSTHTGTQPVSSISGLQGTLDGLAPLASPNFAGVVTAPSFVGPLSGNASTASGLSAGSDKSKLDGIQVGATQNSTDAQLRDRSTHTGTQSASTLSIASGVLIGRAAAGAGAAQEIPLGTGLAFADGVLTATAQGGGGGLANVEDDLSPTLGGNLDVDGFAIKGSTGILLDARFATSGDDYAGIYLDARDGIFMYASDPDQQPTGGQTVLAKGDPGTLQIVTNDGDLRLTANGHYVVSGAPLDMAGNAITSRINLPLVMQPFSGQHTMHRGRLRIGPADFVTGSNQALVISSDNAGNNDSSISLRKYNNSAYPEIGLRRSRGTDAAKTTLLTSDIIGRINFSAYDGSTTFNHAAFIEAAAAEDHTGSNAGMMNFVTIDSGGIIPSRKLHLGPTRSAVYGSFSVEPRNSVGDGNSIIMIDPTAPSIKLGPNLYPMTTGTDGQVLVTDGAGTLSWADAATGGGGLMDGPIELNQAAPTPFVISRESAGDVAIRTTGGRLQLEPGGTNPDGLDGAVEIGGTGILSAPQGLDLRVQPQGGSVCLGGGNTASLLAFQDLELLANASITAAGVNGDVKIKGKGTGRVLVEGPLVQADASGNEVLSHQFSGQTTNASALSLGSVDIPQGKAATFQVMITGLKTNTAGDIASFVITGLVRNDSGTASVAAQTQQVIHRTDDAWAASAAATGGQLVIYVSGNSGDTVKWTAAVRLAYVG